MQRQQFTGVLHKRCAEKFAKPCVRCFPFNLLKFPEKPFPGHLRATNSESVGDIANAFSEVTLTLLSLTH